MRRFNVRIYGLLVKGNQVLITDELIGNKMITKFPGGGLEFGEGSIDCLKREFAEEMNLEIDVLAHFYTTDFFVASAFDDSQVISIYYLVTANDMELKDISLFNHDKQSFKWLSINTLDANDFTFPIDKKVAELLRNSHNQ